MNLLTQPVGVSHYLIVGAILFVTGAVCMATKRNALGVLMGIELVLNGANVNFVAFGSEYLRPGVVGIGLDGQLIALFVIVLAAAEAAVALAIRHQKIPPTANLDVPDPECDLDYTPHGARCLRLDCAMLNSHGFGGGNTSMVMEKAERA